LFLHLRLFLLYRDEQYHWIQNALKLRHVHIHAFGKMNFIHTVLSKRKLTWFVEQGLVEGWFDPRFPTIQGCVRRGMNVEALKNFIIGQGASRRVITMVSVGQFRLLYAQSEYAVLVLCGVLRFECVIAVCFSNARAAMGLACLQEWDKFWSENKKVLEERAPRYMGVSVQDKVTLTLENVDPAVTEHQVQIHPQKPEMGMRVMRRCSKVRTVRLFCLPV
jgi:glutamyl-tRNA synthetase